MLGDIALLAVEDEPSNMELLVFIFRMYEAKADYAKSGSEAIAMLTQKHHYDVILTDIQMPRMDGHMLFKEIRAKQELRHIPIIALTANVMPADRKLMEATGFDGFIEKPIDIDSLPDQILDVIRRWKDAHVTQPNSLVGQPETTERSTIDQPVQPEQSTQRNLT